MAQTYRIIFVSDESYSIIKNVPERIAKDKKLVLKFLHKNNFLPSHSIEQSEKSQYIIFPEPVDTENIESFYVPDYDHFPGAEEIPYVTREL